jgi:hypothetical protein
MRKLLLIIPLLVATSAVSANERQPMDGGGLDLIRIQLADKSGNEIGRGYELALEGELGDGFVRLRYRQLDHHTPLEEDRQELMGHFDARRAFGRHLSLRGGVIFGLVDSAKSDLARGVEFGLRFEPLVYLKRTAAWQMVRSHGKSQTATVTGAFIRPFGDRPFTLGVTREQYDDYHQDLLTLRLGW